MAEPQRSPLFKGYKKVLVSVRLDQEERLRTEAVAQMQRSGAKRLDASAIVRDALDAWFAKVKR